MRRQGCTRTVFLVRSWAIKLPSPVYGFSRFLLGWYSNRAERDSWSWSGGAEELCPVLGCYLFGLVLVMRRAELVDYENLLPGELYALRKYTTDLHSGNVGRLDGRLVVLDYA